ncbi:MAG: argininosuccinate lyase, partial [Clostridiales bacterium]|nr:argininosuccinate lyase [Clostridiales bacterium]
MKLWEGRFQKELSETTNDFNSSISFDSRMFSQDITGSIAHATMLGAKGIITDADMNSIIYGLTGILEEIKSGELEIDRSCEDI